MRNDRTIPIHSAGAAGLDLDDLVDDRVDEGVFRVNRAAFTDQAVFQAELEHIFESTWLFIGLESQIANPHDFVTTTMGRQPVLLTRDAGGAIACFLNTCRHRGAVVCPSKSGNARVHVCRYHGWTYDSAGCNTGVAQRKDGQYPPQFDDADRNLTPIARLASYRGFIFGSLSADVPPLAEHLGEAALFLDLVADQSPRGVEYVPGSVAYTFDANWKLQFENGLDYYHFATTHSAYMDVLQQRSRSGTAAPARTYEADDVAEATGTYTFAHGHALMYAIRKQGRVHNRPLANDPGAMDEIRGRVGEVHAKWMLRQRNLTIFPNLQIVDISAQQLRTWRPLAPDKTEMVGYCLAPIGEGDAARALRIRNYEDFFNPSGLGSSDDNIMYEYVQTGYEAGAGGDTLGYLRGMGPKLSGNDPHAGELGLQPESWAYGPVSFGDETCFQAGYREWKRLLARGQREPENARRDNAQRGAPCASTD